MRVKELTVAVLLVTLSTGSAPARAEDGPSIVHRAEIDQALSMKADADEASRATIRALLHREDVKAMAGEMGFDLRRAESSVSTLEGPGLERVARRAAAANDLLSGGSGGTIRISVVTLLLLLIIVILLAD